jgi:hypothetical protein
MQTKEDSYRSALESLSITDLKSFLKESLQPYQVTELIKDILKEDTHHLRPWLEEDPEDLPREGLKKKLWALQKASLSTTDLAFHFLARQPRVWLNEHAEAFEAYIQEQWDSHKRAFGSDRLKALIADTGACVSVPFLKKFIESNPLSKVEELEAYILMAKILEKEGPLDTENLKGMINFDQNPHLIPFYLYIHREVKPGAVIAFLAFHFEEKGEELKEELNFNFMSTYLRQSIYNFLKGADEKKYQSFLSSRDQLTHPWLKDLFEEVMEHPALEDIEKKCKEIRKKLLAPNEKNHNEFLNELDGSNL